MTKRSSDLWYKRYPARFRKATSHLPYDLRCQYSDLLDLFYEHDGPLPNDDKWIACALFCDVRKWKHIRKALTGFGMLFVGTDGLIHNNTVDEVIEERADQLEKNGSKPKKKRLGATKIGASTPASTPPSTGVGSGASTPPDLSETANEINGGAQKPWQDTRASSEGRSEIVDGDCKLGLSPNKKQDPEKSIFSESAGDRLIPFSSTDAASIIEIGRVAAFREKHGIGDDKRLPFSASVLRQISLLGVEIEPLIQRYLRKTKGKTIKDASAYLITMAHEEAAKAVGVSVATLRAISTNDLQQRGEAMAEAVGAKKPQPEWVRRMQVNRERSALANTNFISQRAA